MGFRSQVVSKREGQRGSTIVGGLVAGAIVSTAVVGMTSLGTYLYKQSEHARLLNLALSVQNKVENALLNKAQYLKVSEEGSNARDADIIAMAAGASPNGFRITGGSQGAGELLAINKDAVGYDENGVGHVGIRTTDPLYVELEIACAMSTPGCGVAYRVVIKSTARMTTPAALGAPYKPPVPSTTIPVFDRFADFTMKLSYDYINQKQLPSRCTPGTDILITGLFRTTGALHCVSTAVNRCDVHRVAHGVVARGGRLEMACHPYAEVECPPDYVLQNYDFGQLDQGVTFTGGRAIGTAGRCVYKWKTNIPWQQPWPVQSTSSSTTVQIKTCNSDVYDSLPAGACYAAVESSSPGSCAYSCNCVTDDDNNTSCDTCYYDAWSSASVSQSLNPSTNVAECTVSINNSCGSSMSAHPQWSGSCAVRERGRNPSLTSAPRDGTLN